MSISEIQSRIAQLEQLLGGASSTAATTDGTAFASALTAATGGTPGTASLAAGAAGLTAATGTGLTGSGSYVSTAATGADVVADAKKYLGVPYVFGGTSTSGIDCSGLVQKVMGDLGVKVPRVVQDQAKVGAQVASLKDAQPGDLIMLNGNDHVVIYLGDHKVLHAPKPGDHVKIAPVWFDDSQITTIRRVVPSQADAQAAAATSASAASTAAGSSMASALAALSALGGGSSSAGLSGISGLGALSGTTGLGSLGALGTGGTSSLGSLAALSGLGGTTGSSATDLTSYYRSLMLSSLTGRTA